MNRKLIGLPIALLFVVAGCKQNESSGTSSTSSSTTSSTSTPPAGTSSTTTTGSGMSATATVTDSGGSEVTTPSGLKYKDLVVGTGATAQPGSSVVVKYTGWLTDGTQFDSGTYPLTIGQHRVITGWEEGLTGMKVGGKRKLTVPSALGYGEQGYGTIPPNATLVFDVELMEAK